MTCTLSAVKKNLCSWWKPTWEGMEALEGVEFLTLLDDCLADVSSRIEETNDEIKAKVERVAKGDLPTMWT